MLLLQVTKFSDSKALVKEVLFKPETIADIKGWDKEELRNLRIPVVATQLAASGEAVARRVERLLLMGDGTNTNAMIKASVAANLNKASFRGVSKLATDASLEVAASTTANNVHFSPDKISVARGNMSASDLDNLVVITNTEQGAFLDRDPTFTGRVQDYGDGAGVRSGMVKRIFGIPRFETQFIPNLGTGADDKLLGVIFDTSQFMVFDSGDYDVEMWKEPAYGVGYVKVDYRVFFSSLTPITNHNLNSTYPFAYNFITKAG